MEWLTTLPAWLSHLFIGCYLVALMVFASLTSIRMGRTPLWVLGLLVPVVQVGIIWYLAFSRWPRLDGEDET